MLLHGWRANFGRCSILTLSAAAPRKPCSSLNTHSGLFLALAGKGLDDADDESKEAKQAEKAPLPRFAILGHLQNQLSNHESKMGLCKNLIQTCRSISSIRNTDANSSRHGSENGKHKRADATLLMGGEGVEDLEAALKDLELQTHPNDSQIGMICLKLAQACDSADEDPEKILHYSTKALHILGTVQESLHMAACLHVMGSAYYKLQEFEKAKAKLEQAARILEKLKDKVGELEINSLSHTVQFLLGHAKLALDMGEAALQHYVVSLRIKERLLYPGDPNLGLSYQQVADVCLELGYLEEAENICSKALEILENFYGENSVQVVTARKLMASIYTEVGDYQKALQEHGKLRPVLEAQGLSGEITSLDLSISDALIGLENYEEAVPVLESVIKVTTNSSLLYSTAMVSLAQVHAKINKRKHALKYCKAARISLIKNRSEEAADCFIKLASVYEDLNEIDEAITIYKKALALLEGNVDLKEDTADAQSQLGMLLLFKGRVDEAVFVLKKAVLLFRETFESENEEVIPGPVGIKLLALYNHLGTANIELKEFDEAVEAFEHARRLSCSLLGPDDVRTITIYQNLVRIYPILGRFDFAIKCQDHIVQSARKLGEASLEMLEEAERKLAQLVEESKNFKMDQT